MSAYTFRPYVEADINFIQSSWGLSFYSDHRSLFSPETFHHYHRPIRTRILTRPNLAIIVCVASEDEHLILGWIMVEALHKAHGLVLHYLYVKQAFKGEGIASELFRSVLKLKEPLIVSHLTNKAKKLLETKNINYFFAPHLT